PDGLSSLDESAGARPPSLPRSRHGTARRAGTYARWSARLGGLLDRGGAPHARNLGSWAGISDAAPVARRRQDLARRIVRGRARLRPPRPRAVCRVPSLARRPADIRRNQARHVRLAAAGLRHGRAPDVPVLREQRRSGSCRLASVAVAGGILGADPGPSLARVDPRIRMAVVARSWPFRPDRILAVAQLAAQHDAPAVARVVRRLRLAADRN